MTLIVFTSGAAFVEQLLPAVFNMPLTGYFLIAFKAGTIVAIVLFVDRFASESLKLYADKVEILRTS